MVCVSAREREEDACPREISIMSSTGSGWSGTRGRRRARERKEVFSLVERGAILLMSVGYFVYALIAHPYLPPIPALGGILALLARRRP